MSMLTDAQNENVFMKRLEMADIVYGSVVKRSKEYLKDVDTMKKPKSLLMIDRYLLLCKKQVETLESEQQCNYYGNLSSDVKLANIKAELNLVLAQLRDTKKDLIEKGYTNSLLKYLPDSNRFSNME